MAQGISEESYERCEKVNKKCVKQWLDKFNACDTYEQFKKVCSNYEKGTNRNS